jgi:hypothetical protein
MGGGGRSALFTCYWPSKKGCGQRGKNSLVDKIYEKIVILHILYLYFVGSVFKVICTSCNGPGFDPSIRRHSGI